MENFKAEVEVAVNKLFFMWVFGFEGKVRIKEPQDVCEQYRQMIMRAADTIAIENSNIFQVGKADGPGNSQ